MLAFALVAIARVAEAQQPQPAPDKPPNPTPEEEKVAEQHYKNGLTFFQAGNFSAARAEFEAAYQLTRYPDLLFNLATVARKQNRAKEEAKYLEEYLATGPKDSAPIKDRIVELRQLYPELAPPPPPGTQPPPPPSKLPPVPALALLGAGTAMLIIGFGCGGAALSAANQVGDTTTPGRPFTAELLLTQERGHQLNSAAIAFDVLGGAALAAGAAWTGYWLYQRHKQKNAPLTAPVVMVSPGRGGIGITLSRSF